MTKYAIYTRKGTQKASRLRTVVLHPETAAREKDALLLEKGEVMILGVENAFHLPDKVKPGDAKRCGVCSHHVLLLEAREHLEVVHGYKDVEDVAPHFD